MVKAAIVGFGSIGKRHFRVLETMGAEVSVVSRRKLEIKNKIYNELAECLKSDEFDLIVISNDTSSHYDSLKTLSENKFKGRVLVEKPIFNSVHDDTNISEELKKNTFVGYNLRFHPLTQKLREVLADENIMYSNTYCGSYLPAWRPERDHKELYSSHRSRGGGVLRDLSHELDLIGHLVGPVDKKIGSLISGHGEMCHDVEEVASLIFKTKNCPHNIVSINYWDKSHSRQISLITPESTFKADFSEGRLYKNGALIFESQVERDQMYEDQLKSVLGDASYLCSYSEGVKILSLIESTEAK